MSLDITLSLQNIDVFTKNITHNLNKMASECGLYQVMWRPEEFGIQDAVKAIPLLQAGLFELLSRPSYYQQWNPENGWGDYRGLVNSATDYLIACHENPYATISVCR